MFIWFIFRDSTAQTWFSGVETTTGTKKPAYNAFARRAKGIVGQSQIVAPGKTFSVKVPVPVMAYLQRRRGRKVGDDLQGLSRQEGRRVAQPLLPLPTDGTVTIPVNFKPVKGKTYTMTVNVERQARPHGAAEHRAAPELSAGNGGERLGTARREDRDRDRRLERHRRRDRAGARRARAPASIGGARRVERLETDVALALDVTDPESCERFVDAAGPVDILVNAAGLALGRVPVDESTEEDEQTVIETNVNGLMRMTRLVLQRSLREPGHIVNIGSIAGHWAYPFGASYIAVEVRGPRLHARAARGSARTRHPRHDRRRRARRDRVLARPLLRRRREGEVGLRGHAAAARPTTSPSASCSRSRGRRTSSSTSSS